MGMLKIAPKALHFLKFLEGGPPNPPHPNERATVTPFRTFPAAFHPVYYSTKKIFVATFIVSLLPSVYISNVFASLVVQF